MDKCLACRHPRVRELDALLLAGVKTVQELSDTFHLGYGSVRRHKLNNHLRGMDIATGETDDLGTTDLLSRYVNALRDAEQVRGFAVASQRPDLLLRASRESRAAIEYLPSELGVDDLDIVRQLEHAGTFARAMGRVVRQVPELAAILAEKLRDEGDTELATVVEDVGQRHIAMKREKAAS